MTDKPFFEAAYSPLVQLANQMGGKEHEDRLRRLLEATVKSISSKPDVVRSLCGVKPPGGTHYRQCDLRATEDGPIVIKTFTGWNHERQCWRIMVEAPEEQWAEQNQEHAEMN